MDRSFSPLGWRWQPSGQGGRALCVAATNDAGGEVGTIYSTTKG